MTKDQTSRAFSSTDLRAVCASATLHIMTVTALLFASYAEALGTPSVELLMSPGDSVGDALARLRAMPGGDRVPPAPLVAVNLVYRRRDHVLAAGDELAVIPPVAGG